jgi:ABC-type transport system involved in cytochrome c biogenesis ATPase subunit
MAHLRKITIAGLFGLYDHDLDLRQDPPLTIVAGPNGVGKTTLLRLTTALLRGAYRELLRYEFGTLSVENELGATIEVERTAERDLPSEAALFTLRFRHGVGPPQEATIEVQPPVADLIAMPDFLEHYDSETFVDVRDGELISEDDVLLRWGGRVREPIRPPTPPDWFHADEWRVDFIETKRLDTLLSSSLVARRPGPRLGPGVAHVERRGSPINRYLQVVANSLENARLESARINQARTSTVARRLLGEYSSKTVNVGRLRERYAQVERHAAALTANGLLSDSLAALPGGKLNPTQKRFFEMFLDDFEAKLEPLDPVSEKLEQLRSIIGHKFLNKELAISPEHGLTFAVEPAGNEIVADSLSSGEQHELALISRLLFDERAGTTVLIDEPELSLHVSWQHEMVEDLLEIARVSDVSFVLATHSTAIINNRWDIVNELGPLDFSPDERGQHKTSVAT